MLSSVSVNVDRKESNLTKIDNSVLETVYENLFAHNYLTFTPDENYFDQITQARFGTELWKYFLIIVILLSLIEMYVARSTKKDIMTLEK